MILILDTDHLTVIQRQSEPAYSNLIRRLEVFPQGDVRTTIVNYEEQLRGWLSLVAAAKNSKQEISAYQRLQSSLTFFSQVLILDYDQDSAEEYSKLRNLRLHIGTMDLKIAAIALSKGGLLLSRNLKDFQQVHGLHVEDWTK